MPVRLTILIPTRNRPEMAVRAAASIMRTPVPGVRVVVSDNSGAEHRARLLAALASTEATVLQTPAEMTMSDHWQWALDQVREREAPTHLGVLTDRFVYKPGALSALVRNVIEPYADNVVVHHHDQVNDASTPVRLHPEVGSGSLFRCDPQPLLDNVAKGLAWNWELPRMMNSIAPIRLLDELQTRNGRVFSSIAPDHYFGYWAAAVEESFVCWDASPTVHYAHDRSNGVAQAKGTTVSADAADFARHISQAELRSPFPQLRTLSNYIFHEYNVVAHQSQSPKFRAVTREAVVRALRADATVIEDQTLRDAILVQVGEPDATPAPRAAQRVRSQTRQLLETTVAGILGVAQPSSVARWVRHDPRVTQRLRFPSTEAALDAAVRINLRFPPHRPTGATTQLSADFWG